MVDQIALHSFDYIIIGFYLVTIDQTCSGKSTAFIDKVTKNQG